VRRIVAVAVVMTLLFEPGCALLLRGSTGVVELSGNEIEVDGKPEKPGPLELRRRQVHVVSAVVKGQRETRTLESDLSPAWFTIDLVVFGIVLAPIGSVAFLVDLATGSLNEFDSREIDFPKTPAPPEATCPQCQSHAPAGARFCSECGAPLR
jgi:hypothetical protein